MASKSLGLDIHMRFILMRSEIIFQKKIKFSLNTHFSALCFVNGIFAFVSSRCLLSLIIIDMIEHPPFNVRGINQDRG